MKFAACSEWCRLSPQPLAEGGCRESETWGSSYGTLVNVLVPSGVPHCGVDGASSPRASESTFHEARQISGNSLLPACSRHRRVVLVHAQLAARPRSPRDTMQCMERSSARGARGRAAGGWSLCLWNAIVAHLPRAHTDKESRES